MFSDHELKYIAPTDKELRALVDQLSQPEPPIRPTNEPSAPRRVYIIQHSKYNYTVRGYETIRFRTKRSAIEWSRRNFTGAKLVYFAKPKERVSPSYFECIGRD